MSFSDELNNYIDLLDCSTKDICNISGLSPTLLSRYINGKRTPRVKSTYFKKLVDSIYKISIKKNICLSQRSIYKNLEQSTIRHGIHYDSFITNLNTLIVNLNIPNTDFAKALGYDASFISRIRNNKRKPADIDGFIYNTCTYIAENYSNENKKEIVSEVLQCPKEELNNPDNYKKNIIRWMINR